MKCSPVEPCGALTNLRHDGGVGARREKVEMACMGYGVKLRPGRQSRTHCIRVERRGQNAIVIGAPELHWDADSRQPGPIEGKAQGGRRDDDRFDARIAHAGPCARYRAGLCSNESAVVKIGMPCAMVDEERQVGAPASRSEDRKPARREAKGADAARIDRGVAWPIRQHVRDQAA